MIKYIFSIGLFVALLSSTLIAGLNVADCAARRCLDLFAKRQFETLADISSQDKIFEVRLFASYLLYRYNKKQYMSNFIKAFPNNDNEYCSYVSIPSSLTCDPGAETYKMSKKGVPWPISFWEMHEAACNLARRGHRKCISSVLNLSRYGDGEIGEGMSEDACRLFCYPTLVANNWDLFKGHLEFLSSLKASYSDQQFAKIRKSYISAFSKDRLKLMQILNMIDKAEM